MSGAEFIGFDADGDKVWRDSSTGLVTYASTQQGAEWTFECGGGTTRPLYDRKFGPVTSTRLPDGFRA